MKYNMKKIQIRLWHKIILGILLFLVLLLFAAPRVARYYIIKNSYELVGRRLNIRKIYLNLKPDFLQKRHVERILLNSDGWMGFIVPIVKDSKHG